MRDEIRFDNQGEVGSQIHIWHSEVHRRFNESLYYFLCTVRPYVPEEFKKKLTGFLQEQGLKGYCFYEIFGAYDILLRIWLPAEIEVGFSSNLRTKLMAIDHLIPYKVTDFPLYWLEDHFKPERSSLNTITPALIATVQENADQNQAKEFSQKHLLRKNSKTDDTKFFVSISRPQDPMSNQAQEEIVFEIKEELERRVNAERIYRPSIYEGFGFGWLLIKAETHDFREIGLLYEELFGRLVKSRSYTTTYIASGLVNEESFKICKKSLTAAKGKNLAVANIVPEIYFDGIAIDEATKRSVEAWVREAVVEAELEEKDQELIRNVLVGVIMDEPQQTLIALYTLFTSIEFFLRSECNNFIGRKLGRKAIREICQTLGVSKEPGKHLAIGELLQIAGNAIMQSEYASDLGFDAKGSWEKAAKLRNEVMHGDLKITSDTWKDTISYLPEFLSRYRRIERILQK